MKYVLCVLGIAALSSCSPYQVITTEADTDNVKISGGFYTYEDDTLIIRYDLWGNGGKIKMSIYNKIEKPIYIDWNKSSFVYNGEKRSYYHERSVINSVAINANETSVRRRYGRVGAYNAGATVMSGVSEKEERITFIPPNTTVTRN